MLALTLRLLFAAWGLHFYDLQSQVTLVGGRHGYSPVDAQLRAVAAGLASKSEALWWNRFKKVKTIFWWRRDDAFLRFVPCMGVVFCIIGAVGYASRWMFVASWFVYHSLDVVFFDGFAYPWQNLMFEVGFLSIFAPPLVPWLNRVEWDSQPHFLNVLVVYSYRWLLFRLMFGFGKTKFLDDQDRTDNNMYIRNFLYAQPMPNKIARFLVDRMPKWNWLWGAQVWFMWLVEIPIPFLALTPWRGVAALTIPMLQLGIMAGGCFGQFNLLTMILCLPLMVDIPPEIEPEKASEFDQFLSSVPVKVTVYFLFTLYAFATLVCVCCLNSGTTQMWSYYCELTRELYPSTSVSKTGASNVTNSRWINRIVSLVRFFNEWRIVHGYGLFPRNKLEKVRLTPTIEGTWDGGKTWEAYQWRYLNEFHWTVAPFQPKMDFTMWYNGNGMNMEGFTVSVASPRPFLFSECGMPSRIALRLLEGRPEMESAFAYVPHRNEGTKPSNVRIRIYDDNGVCFMQWKPAQWENWLHSAAEEWHWDCYQQRLDDSAFLQAALTFSQWVKSAAGKAFLEKCGNGISEKEESAMNEQLILSRYVSTYDGELSGFSEVKITEASLLHFWKSGFSPTRENRFVHTYLIWNLVHVALLPKPLSKERSWFELSLIANSIILRGMEATLLAIRSTERSQKDDNVFFILDSDVVEVPAEDDIEKRSRLSDEYVFRTSTVWKTLYPIQWQQTIRTLKKLLRFDPFNTGAKLSGSASKDFHKVTVLQYPQMFVDSLKKDK